MSNIQRRSKTLSQVPILDMTDNKTEIPFNDPRSPSANVTRTPVDLYSYHLPTVPTVDSMPIKSTQ